MSKISIIIPTFNNVSGVNYLLNYFKDEPYQVIVIDNNPKIKKFKSLRFNEFKNLIYLPQKENLGFAKAVNLAAKYVNNDWMLILNDDVEFQVKSLKLKFKKYPLKSKNLKNPIDLLVDYAEKNKFDAISPILINPNGEVENFGYKVLPYGKIELVKKLENFEKFKRLEKLDGLTAACLLVKTEVFKKLNGFDEYFFAYLEDVDFFLRFKKAGFRMAIAYDIEVLHNHMTTSKTMGSFKARLDMINWWRLYFKHKDVFKFDLRFLVERLRNVTGYIKIVLNLKKNLNILSVLLLSFFLKNLFVFD